MPRKKTLKTLKRDLMLLAKANVKSRDKQRCQFCAEYVEGRNCHASHIIPETAHPKLRYDTTNMIVLCYRHHLWWHENPCESGPWFVKEFPRRWEYLRWEFRTVPKSPPTMRWLYAEIAKHQRRNHERADMFRIEVEA